jgi:hypothetical protein
MLHPEFALSIWKTEACATLVTEGAELLAVRRALLERAGSLGHATTEDPAVHLVVEGVAILPETTGRILRFHLPETRGVRLVSRRAVPAHLQPDSSDHRCLGIAVSRIAVDGEEISLTDPRLGGGWHAAESGWRWTNGEATLAIAGARMLELEIAMTGRYWLPAADIAAPRRNR